MTLLAQHADAEVHHCDWRALAKVVRERGGCDALIVDAPYSERTHAGHDDGTATANRVAQWAAAHPEHPRAKDRAMRVSRDGTERRSLNYPAWTHADVHIFVETWAPLVRGWIVSLTDHVLAPAWETALEAAGRYTFAPLSCVEPGSRVRMTGDGPSNWACLAIVSRPRCAPFSKWGALPGAYVVPPGHRETLNDRNDGVRVVGGKPLWLMERLVEDYSRPGDLVVDPCCGAGTTLVAAQRTGRKSIGGDVLREHADLAAKRISRPAQQPLFAGGRS